MGRKSRRQRKYQYSDVSESSGAEDESDEEPGRNMQVALRDKEGLLVQKALDRIRRAQELGKTNVKLPVSELQALERNRQRDDENIVPKASSKSKAYRRRSGLLNESNKASRSNSGGKEKVKSRLAAYDNDSPSSSRRGTPPGILAPGPGGVPVYHPLDYYPPTASTGAVAPKSKGSRLESRSSSSYKYAPQPTSPPLVNSAGRSGKRHLNSRDNSTSRRSSQTSSRRLPDDPYWLPRPRSSSSIAGAPYPPDQHQYQAYSPPLPQVPPQYAQQVHGSRRAVSTPQQLSKQYDGQPAHHNRLGNRDPESSFRRRAVSADGPDMEGEAEDSSEEGSDSDEDSSGGQEQGVQVDAASYMRGFSIPEDKGREKQRRGKR